MCVCARVHVCVFGLVPTWLNEDIKQTEGRLESLCSLLFLFVAGVEPVAFVHVWATDTMWGIKHCGIKEETSALMLALGHSHPLSRLTLSLLSIPLLFSAPPPPSPSLSLSLSTAPQGSGLQEAPPFPPSSSSYLGNQAAGVGDGADTAPHSLYLLLPLSHSLHPLLPLSHSLPSFSSLTHTAYFLHRHTNSF